MRKLYSIRDALVGFGVAGNGVPAIIDLPNDEVLVRVVKGSCASGAKPNYLNVNPEDKEIWCVGDFNQDTGEITPCKPRLVLKVIDYIEKGIEDVTSSENAEEAGN